MWLVTLLQRHTGRVYHVVLGPVATRPPWAFSWPKSLTNSFTPPEKAAPLARLCTLGGLVWRTAIGRLQPRQILLSTLKKLNLNA